MAASRQICNLAAKGLGKMSGPFGLLLRARKTPKSQEPKSLGCSGLLVCSERCTHLPARAGAFVR